MKKLVSYRLPEKLIYRMKQKAQEDGISVTDLVHELLDDGLQRDLPRGNLPEIPAAIVAPSDSLAPIGQPTTSTASHLPVCREVAMPEYDRIVDIRVQHLEKQVKDLKRSLERQALELDKMRNRYLEDVLELLKEQRQISQLPH